MEYIKNPYNPPSDEPMLKVKNYVYMIDQILAGAKYECVVNLLAERGDIITERETHEFMLHRIDPVHVAMGPEVCKAFLGVLGDTKLASTDIDDIINMQKARLAYLLKAEEEAIKDGLSDTKQRYYRTAVNNEIRMIKDSISRKMGVDSSAGEVKVEPVEAEARREEVEGKLAEIEGKKEAVDTPLVAATPLDDVGSGEEVMGFDSANKILNAIEVLSRADKKSVRTVEDEVGDALGEKNE